jgi:GNAT superfamily N-acetyltransferase
MNHSNLSVRVATREDVKSLLDLLPQITSRPDSLSAKTLGLDESMRIFDEISDSGNVFIVVGESANELVAALTMAIVPNFTYGGRPWSIIENVVVAREQRGKGFGKELMAFAFDLAKDRGCYKAQLLSGPNDDQVGFYKSLGMQDGTSQGFKKYFVERKSEEVD